MHKLFVIIISFLLALNICAQTKDSLSDSIQQAKSIDKSSSVSAKNLSGVSQATVIGDTVSIIKKDKIIIHEGFWSTTYRINDKKVSERNIRNLYCQSGEKPLLKKYRYSQFYRWWLPPVLFVSGLGIIAAGKPAYISFPVYFGGLASYFIGSRMYKSSIRDYNKFVDK